MATQLDLQEQEQLDALKAFWNKYGNLITWTLILVLGAYAAWNGWQYWQRDQGMKAGAMFDELERAAVAGDADKAGRVLADLQRQIDLMLEVKLREVLAPALTRATDALMREARTELASTLRDIVSRAVAQELSRHRQR